MNLQKEVEDYIKVQRSLGVPDSEIRKSLVNAGYREEQFSHMMNPHHHKEQTKEFSPSNKNLFAMNMFILVAFTLMVLYIASDYNSKITNIASEQKKNAENVNTQLSTELGSMRSQLAGMESSLKNELTSTNAKIDSTSTLLEQRIAETSYESLTRDSKLSDSIQRATNMSLTELTGFQAELEGFKESSVDFSKVIPKALSSVVTIGKKGNGYFSTAGSGVLINNIGHIVTNYHVIDDLSKIAVRTNDKNEYTATVVGKNEAWDIAVIKLTTEKKTFEYLEFGDSSKVKVGEPIIAVGNPVGLEATVTQGIISNTRRLINDDKIYYFQTDVAINAGNSGGPLINTGGKIIGIATLKYAKTGFEGLSFALRSNDIQGFVFDILKTA